MYPNPASDHVSLEIDLDKSEILNVGIYSLNGTRISNQTKRLDPGKHVLIKQLDLPNGQYFIGIQNQNGQFISVEKLIVNNLSK